MGEASKKIEEYPGMSAAPPPPPASDFKLHIQAVPGDGDCLFFSVAHILRDRFKDADEKGSMPDIKSFAKYMRSKVALRVLDESDAECTEIINTWHSLWYDALREKDMEMMHEMKHMHNVLRPLSKVDRRILFRNMMEPSIYWGDEFALQSMERFLGCMFVVVNERFAFVQRQYSRITLEEPKWISMLLLRGAHYEPLHDNSGNYCWAMDALPPLIQNLISQFKT
jgi:hypothetical protein